MILSVCIRGDLSPLDRFCAKALYMPLFIDKLDSFSSWDATYLSTLIKVLGLYKFLELS